MDKISYLRQEFQENYESVPDFIFFAPGRVNLIGEHIDYNGGLVFPCALTVGTYLAIKLREDTTIRMRSLNFNNELETPLTELNKTNEWFDYPIGVLKALEKEGIEASGMDMLYYGTIPNGSGLSSSASIEVVTAYALNAIAQKGINTVDLVKLSQKVENEFIGVNCGIMDQFAVGMGKENHAIALNCDTLEYDYVPLATDEYILLIGNTKVQRKLADSKYNERLGECREALRIAQKTFKVNHLCELSLEQLESVAADFENKMVYRRARHVVTEQERVVKAIKLLKANDLAGFGKLMNASHDSLRDDYEVTGEALDTMVAEGRKIEGVLGSRMTGAGFGGCTVTLLHKDSVQEFIDKVGKHYKEKLQTQPEFYAVGVGNGVMEIKN